MDYKKLLIDVLVVAVGVALYDVAFKPLLNKAKIVK